MLPKIINKGQKMNLIKIETEVTKEVHEIGLAFKKIMISYKEATADGFQAGQDIPAVLMASYQDLMKAFEGAEMSDEEIKEAPVKAIMGAVVPLSEGLEVLLEKKEDAV